MAGSVLLLLCIILVLWKLCQVALFLADSAVCVFEGV